MIDDSRSRARRWRRENETTRRPNPGRLPPRASREPWLSASTRLPLRGEFIGAMAVKIWIVEIGEYEMRCVSGVFSTYAKAVEHAREHGGSEDDICEFTLDGESATDSAGEKHG